MIYVYIITLLLLTVYAALIAYYNSGWNKQPARSAPVDFMPQTSISVIVPARNEELHLAACLQSILQQDYPAGLLEVIVVDDQSTDRTAALAASFPGILLLQPIAPNVRAPKKFAIETGIAAAAGTLIVTTDADCTAPQLWLKQLAWIHESTSAQLIAAPVMMKKKASFLAAFEALDFLSLQGITAAAAARNTHSMCNGANLAYTKSAFEKVEGFRQIDQIASGDDMLLMQKIAREYPSRIAYAKSPEAIVVTEPVASWKAFFQQRIRWASKARFYDEFRLKAVLLLVYSCNIFLFISIVAAFFSLSAIFPALLLLLVKTVAEWAFMWKVAAFFRRQDLMPWFIFFQPFHVLYTVIAGSFSQFGSYEWKGRKLR